MGSFRRFEKSLEEKFQHDKLLEFKIISRRNRLLGLWAAQQMNFNGAAAESYARQIVSLNVARPGVEPIIRRILNDFSQKGITLSEHQLKKQIMDLEQDVGNQILETGIRG